MSDFKPRHHNLRHLDRLTSASVRAEIRPVPKECFLNSIRALGKHPGWRYVEGWVALDSFLFAEPFANRVREVRAEHPGLADDSRQVVRVDLGLSASDRFRPERARAMVTLPPRVIAASPGPTPFFLIEG